MPFLKRYFSPQKTEKLKYTRFLSKSENCTTFVFSDFCAKNILLKMACFVSPPWYRKNFLKTINRLIIKYLNHKDMLVVLEVVALLAVIVLPLFPAKKTANK